MSAYSDGSPQGQLTAVLEAAGVYVDRTLLDPTPEHGTAWVLLGSRDLGDEEFTLEMTVRVAVASGEDLDAFLGRVLAAIDGSEGFGWASWEAQYAARPIRGRDTVPVDMADIDVFCGAADRGD